MLKSLCVFCGSQTGRNPVYADAARELGRTLAARGVRLVYGGGNIGLMGVLADAVLESGGEVTGVIPAALVDRELAHAGVADMRVVESMHARKALMAELSDGFGALPGGLGTLEEFCEILTWAQLEFHHKPVALLNVNGYFDPLIAMFDRAVTEDFLRLENRRQMSIADGIPQLFEQLAAFAPDAERNPDDLRELT